MTQKRHMTQKQLVEAGYQAALAGKPCEAPTTRERDRAAWEQGWRAGHKEYRSMVVVAGEGIQAGSGTVDVKPWWVKQERSTWQRVCPFGLCGAQWCIHTEIGRYEIRGKKGNRYAFGTYGVYLNGKKVSTANLTTIPEAKKFVNVHFDDTLYERDRMRRLAYARSLDKSGPAVLVTYPNMAALTLEITDDEKFQMVDWSLPENVVAFEAAIRAQKG